MDEVEEDYEDDEDDDDDDSLYEFEKNQNSRKRVTLKRNASGYVVGSSQNREIALGTSQVFLCLNTLRSIGSSCVSFFLIFQLLSRLRFGKLKLSLMVTYRN